MKCALRSHHIEPNMRNPISIVAMNKLILLVLTAVLLTACTNSTEMQDKENMELVARYVKAVESLDYEAMDALLDDAYMGLGPSYRDTIYKEEAIANWKYCVENLYEKIEYTRGQYAPVTIKEGVAPGEWVGSWAELNIVFKDGSEEVTVWSNTNYLVKNGKIVRSLTLYNEADVLRQLGYVIVPNEGY